MNEQLEAPTKDQKKDFTGHPGTVTTNNTGGYSSVKFSSADHNPISTPEENLEIVSHELPENATPEIDTQKLEGELKTQKSALEMEDKYPSGNDKVRPAILAKIADLEEKLGINKSEVEDKVETNEPEVAAVAEDEKETSAFEDFTKQSREARGLNEGSIRLKEKLEQNKLFVMAQIRIHSIFGTSSEDKNKELKETGRADIKNGKILRGALKISLGTVSIYGASMIFAAGERYGIPLLGLGEVHAAASGGGPTMDGMTQGEFATSGGTSYDPTGPTGATEAAGAGGATAPVEAGPTGSGGSTGPTGSTSETGGLSLPVWGELNTEKPKPSLPVWGELDTSGKADTNYNRFEQNSHDRMSTHGAFDGTERTSAQLDDHVLAKIQNNPSLMASVMEVRESGNKDANFSLNDVNHDTGEYTVHGENGEYSGKGQDAVKTLEKSWDNGHQGRLLSDERVAKILETSVFINHGTDEGEFKNALDDKTYSAGVFDYRPELGDQIYGKELGNGEVVYFKVNEKDSSRDCLNVLTLREKDVYIPFTPPTPGNPGDDITTDMDWDHTPREWEPNDKKGPTFGADDKDHQYGNNGEIHENDDPETQQEAGSGNPTKPAPAQTERPAAVPDLEVTAPTPPTPATGPVGPSQ